MSVSAVSCFNAKHSTEHCKCQWNSDFWCWGYRARYWVLIYQGIFFWNLCMQMYIFMSQFMFWPLCCIDFDGLILAEDKKKTSGKLWFSIDNHTKMRCNLQHHLTSFSLKFQWFYFTSFLYFFFPSTRTHCVVLASLCWSLCSVFRLRADWCVPLWLELQLRSVKLYSCVLREIGGRWSFWLHRVDLKIRCCYLQASTPLLVK